MKVICLSKIIERLNNVNMKFQDQRMEIQGLKIEMIKYIKRIAALYLTPESFLSNLLLLNKSEFEEIEEQKKHFIFPQSFVRLISAELDIRLEKINTWSESKRNKFTEIFQNLLAEILKYLLHYLSFQDPLNDSLDFVSLQILLKYSKRKS